MVIEIKYRSKSGKRDALVNLVSVYRSDGWTCRLFQNGRQVKEVRTPSMARAQILASRWVGV